MSTFKETAELLKFAALYQEYESSRDLMVLEDLEVYIHSIRNRFIVRPDFPKKFSDGYQLVRSESEAYELKHKKYSREKYFEEE